MDLIEYTWAEVVELFVPIDLIESGLKALGFGALDTHKFVQNGRWLIVDNKFAWDDTTGEWNPIDDIDLDDE